MKYACQYCSQNYRISHEQSGKVIDCHTCGKSIQLPTIDSPVVPQKNEEQPAHTKATKKPWIAIVAVLSLGGLGWMYVNQNKGQNENTEVTEAHSSEPANLNLDLDLESIANELRQQEKDAKVDPHLLAQHEVLHLLGNNADKIIAEDDGKKFLQIFLSNKDLLEDFLCSGLYTSYTNGEFNEQFSISVTNLYKIWKTDPKFTDDAVLRRLAVGAAHAQNKDGRIPAPEKAYLFFRDSHRKQRLHAQFEHMEAWEMRQILRSWTNDPKSWTWAQNEFNMPIYEYAKGYNGVCWSLDYTKNNDFGFNIFDELIDTPENKEMSNLEKIQLNGGICGRMSTFAADVASANGILAEKVGGTAHLAYAVRIKRGDWRAGFGNGHRTSPGTVTYGIGYCSANIYLTEEVLNDREKLLKSNSQLWLSRLHTDSDSQQKHLNAALAIQPLNLKAWQAKYELFSNEQASKTDWINFYQSMAEKTAAYPQIAPEFFHIHSSALALNDTEAIQLYSHFFKSYATSYLLSEKDEAKFRNAKNMFLLHQSVEKDLKKVLDAALKQYPKSKNQILTTLLDAFSGEKLNFDINNWSLKNLDSDLKKVLIARLVESGAGDQKQVLTQALLIAADEHDFAAFQKISELAQPLLKKAKPLDLSQHKFERFGKLLTAKGFLRLPHKGDRFPSNPLEYSRAIKESEAQVRSQRTDQPLVEIGLPKLSLGKALLYRCSKSMLRQENGKTLDVFTSMDGKKWQKITSFTISQEETLLKFKKPVQLKFLKLQYQQGDQSKNIQFNNILLYGDLNE